MQRHDKLFHTILTMNHIFNRQNNKIDRIIPTLYDRAFICSFSNMIYDHEKYINILKLNENIDVVCYFTENDISEMKKYRQLKSIVVFLVNEKLNNKFVVSLAQKYSKILNNINKKRLDNKDKKTIECIICYKYEPIAELWCRCKIQNLCIFCNEKINRCPLCREYKNIITEKNLDSPRLLPIYNIANSYRLPSMNMFEYSFSLTPENFQPTGMVNFSHMYSN